MSTNKILENLSNIREVITDITVYKFNIYATKKFSFGTWTSRQHIFVSISAGGKTAFAENIIVVNNPQVSLDEWMQNLKSFKGKSVTDAILLLRSKMGIWQDRFTELAEMCLIDLSGKILHKSALELLNLSGRSLVHGVHVILSDDLDFVEAQVKLAVSMGKQSFIKVKLFGDNELDKAVVSTVRKHTDKSTFLIGDVNGGYRFHDSTTSIEEIAISLNNLHSVGLDACEDPAYITNGEWVTLQNSVGFLSLIPDYPMRPASGAIKTIIDGMGRIYNIHPGSAGSILDAIELAEKIKSMGAKLMIGDDSLVGCGCTSWQQLAIGLGADWVEATEKVAESDFYYDAVEYIPTNSAKAPISCAFDKFGFGIQLDEKKLAESADEIHHI